MPDNDDRFTASEWRDIGKFVALLVGIFALLGVLAGKIGGWW